MLEIEVSPGPGPLKALKNPSLSLPSPGGLGQHLSSLCLCLHTASSFCLCSSSYEDTSHWIWGLSPIQDDFIHKDPICQSGQILRSQVDMKIYRPPSNLLSSHDAKHEGATRQRHPGTGRNRRQPPGSSHPRLRSASFAPSLQGSGGCIPKVALGRENKIYFEQMLHRAAV